MYHCGASIRNSDLMKALTHQRFNGVKFSECKERLRILNTSSYGGVHRALENLPKYYFSEYYPDVPSRQRAPNGVLCVDLLNIPFPDQSLDVVISEDVLGGYKILLYYDNRYNQADGEDL